MDDFMFFPHTRRFMITVIKEVHTDAVVRENRDDVTDPSHLLFLLERMDKRVPGENAHLHSTRANRCIGLVHGILLATDCLDRKESAELMELFDKDIMENHC
jgi:hypothetical protein